MGTGDCGKRGSIAGPLPPIRKRSVRSENSIVCNQSLGYILTMQQILEQEQTAMRTLIASLFLTLMLGGSALAGEPQVSTGQTLYVPVYSHVYQGPRNKPFYLTVILSIRNTDFLNSLTILNAAYYDSDGNKVEDFIKEPTTLGPMQTKRIVVPEDDRRGGSGANFVVRWSSRETVNRPVVQGVMVSTAGTQGVSFVVDGVPIRDNRK